MFKISTHTPWVLGLALLATLTLGTAPAAADETFVVDRSAGPDACGALFRVDAISGNRALVSDCGKPVQGPNPTRSGRTVAFTSGNIGIATRQP